MNVGALVLQVLSGIGGGLLVRAFDRRLSRAEATIAGALGAGVGGQVLGATLLVAGPAAAGWDAGTLASTILACGAGGAAFAGLMAALRAALVR